MVVWVQEENFMDNTLLTQLKICKLSGTKPNFSELSRKYGYDRRTIKKYFDGYEGKPATRRKHSKLDRHENLIREKLMINGITYKAIYEFILEEIDDSIGSYSNFRKFIVDRGLAPRKKVSGHPRFETLPGVQAQADWKEDMVLCSKFGEIFEFQVFSYKLGYSRYCHFVYRNSKTQQDVFDCLISAFQATGGVPREILFDNMPSIVNIVNGKRHMNERAKGFAKDFGFRIKLAKPRHPFTKGKVESANKFVEWLLAYDGEFETEEELISILEKVNRKVNTTASQATNVPPILLMQDEEHSLNPLPNKRIIESYQEHERETRVHKDSLVTYHSKKFSVPPKYIGHTVALKEKDGILEIFHEGICIARHQITESRINYTEEHYRELLAPLVKDEDLDMFAKENLKQLDQFL